MRERVCERERERGEGEGERERERERERCVCVEAHIVHTTPCYGTLYHVYSVVTQSPVTKMVAITIIVAVVSQSSTTPVLLIALAITCLSMQGNFITVNFGAGIRHISSGLATCHTENRINWWVMQ